LKEIDGDSTQNALIPCQSPSGNEKYEPGRERIHDVINSFIEMYKCMNEYEIMYKVLIYMRAYLQPGNQVSYSMVQVSKRYNKPLER